MKSYREHRQSSMNESSSLGAVSEEQLEEFMRSMSKLSYRESQQSEFRGEKNKNQASSFKKVYVPFNNLSHNPDSGL